MKRAKSVTTGIRSAVLGAGALSLFVAASGAAAPKGGGGDAPNVSSLRTMLEKDLHWGLSHQEVTDAYNNPGGYFDREVLAVKCMCGLRKRR